MSGAGVTPTIGVCEDDDELRGILRDALQREGMTVRPTASGAEAVRDVRGATRPTCSCSTSACPTPTGATSARRCGRGASTTPVLFLTARGSVPDRLSGFHAGGDDYLTKPFALAELLVRVDALLRRAAAAPPPSSATPATSCSTPGATRSATATREESLTPTEFRILASLAGAGGDVVRRQALVAAAWPDGAIVHDNTLHVYLGRIRRKLRSVGVGRGSTRCAGSATGCDDVPRPPAGDLDARRSRSASARCSSSATPSCGASRRHRPDAAPAARARRRRDRRARPSATGTSRVRDSPTTGSSIARRGSSTARGSSSARRASTRRSTAPRCGSGRAGRAAVRARAGTTCALRAAARPRAAGRSAPSSSAMSVEAVERLEGSVLLGSIVLAALLLLAGLLAIRGAVDGALRPVAAMTRDAAAWSANDLDQRFDLGPRRDELTGLAATLDNLLGRIAASRRHEQRFASEVAHELRTPIARMRGRAELALRAGPDGDEERAGRWSRSSSRSTA